MCGILVYFQSYKQYVHHPRRAKSIEQGPCCHFMVLSCCCVSFCQSSEWCHFAKTSAIMLCVLFHGVFMLLCVLLPKQRVVSCSMLCVLLPGVVSCCHAVLCHFAQTSAVMLCVLFHGVSMLCCPFAKSVSGVMLPKQVLSCCVSFFMLFSCCGVSFCQSSEWCHAELCIQLLLSLQQALIVAQNESAAQLLETHNTPTLGRPFLDPAHVHLATRRAGLARVEPFPPADRLKLPSPPRGT